MLSATAGGAVTGPRGRDRPAGRGSADPGGDQARRSPAARPDRRCEDAGADRNRLRGAALAGAVGPGRSRYRAAGDRAGVRRGRDQAAQLRHTSWIILTLVQHARPDQVARWVRPALNQDVIWCQLFSEPGAGSDAAGIRTRATKVKGVGEVGRGITMMVIDMHAPGVTIRPLPTGNSDFNEVFLDDVFVPDTDVVGPADAGWAVARATLGNESVSIGGRDSVMTSRRKRSSRRSTRTRSGWPAGPDGSAGRSPACTRWARLTSAAPPGRGRRPGTGGQHHEAAVRDRP
jgi:hypothetical protein